MKKILIISPHFPPSNLAAVHRSRLFAQHLTEFNWQPVILTVHEKYYEEQLDYDLEKLLPPDLRIEKVKAFKIIKPRLIGDIGLRGFFQLYKRAKKLILTENFDFVYIHIPSFYVALLGRRLHWSTGIKYGIDYIDPWVHEFPGSKKIFSRHWWSKQLAEILEPIAVKRASLITGVSDGYFKGVQERNPSLMNKCIFGAMPYGGEEKDHIAIKGMSKKPYLFNKKNGIIQLVYAGAMLPKAYKLLDALFESLANHIEDFKSVEFHFIGTGKTPNDKDGYNIRPLAEKHNLWDLIVFEYPKRVPYLDVLLHLEASDAVFILGSTEPHYTPSKIYQAVLSKKPIFAILHTKSTGVDVIRSSNAGTVLDINGEEEIFKVGTLFKPEFCNFLQKIHVFNPDSIHKEIFDKYSAYSVTKKLVSLLNKIIF